MLNEITSQSPTIHEANEQQERQLTSEELRDLERRHKFFLCDKAQYIADAKKKARAEGIAEGRAEARAERVAEGMKHKAVEISHKMKTEGFDTETISQLTGLSNEEIENLS